MKPIKFLKGTLGTLTQLSTTTVNGTANVANSWSASITGINTQNHNDNTTPRPNMFNGLDINIGDYVVSTGEGKCLKISAISSQTSATAAITLVDDQNYNYLNDQDLGGIIATGACYVFEVKAGTPLLGNIPATLPGTMLGTFFTTSIANRFQTQYPPTVTVANPVSVSTSGNLVVNTAYSISTATSPVTSTLPISPVKDDCIDILDYTGSFAINNLTVSRNGQKIMGLAEDLIVDVKNASFSLIYTDVTNGWRIKH